MQETISVGDIFKHYKTENNYEVVGFATLQAPDDSGMDMVEVVIYKKVNDEKLWVRSKDMFLEKVNFEGKEVSRFEKVG